MAPVDPAAPGGDDVRSAAAAVVREILRRTQSALLLASRFHPESALEAGCSCRTVGTVIGAEAIGENCTIMQGLPSAPDGRTSDSLPSERPLVGNGVTICAGAKIVGSHHRNNA